MDNDTEPSITLDTLSELPLQNTLEYLSPKDLINIVSNYFFIIFNPEFHVYTYPEFNITLTNIFTY